jgi:hypothetical protein
VLTLQKRGAPAGTRSPEARKAGAPLRSNTPTIPRAAEGASGSPEWWLPEVEWLRARHAEPYTPPPHAAPLPAPDAIGQAAGELVLTALRANVRIPRIKNTPREPLSTFGESVSAKYGHSAPGCSRARRGQWFKGKESGREYRFDLLTCQRRTCPACRPFLTAATAAQLERRFDGLPLYELEVAEEAFEAARKRVNRRGGLYVGVPSPGGRRVVLSTVPANLAREGEPVEVAPEHRRAVLRDLAAHRPMDKRHVVSSRTLPAEDGQENRAGSWLAEVNPQREALEYSGHDTSKADTATVEAYAAEVGLPVTRVLDLPELKALRLEAHPLDPRVEHLKRRLGFTEPHGEIVELKYADDGSLVSAKVTGRRARSAPLAADWHDDPALYNRHRKAEQPPLDAYPEADPTFTEAAA